VNKVLKAARAPAVQSFHYGSVAGEARFGERSSNEWMRRFDSDEVPLARSPSPATVAEVSEPRPGYVDRCEGGQPCPREGWWFTPAKPASRRKFAVGELMPKFKSDYGTTIWQWASRQQP
jgi:hypothetical protein